MHIKFHIHNQNCIFQSFNINCTSIRSWWFKCDVINVSIFWQMNMVICGIATSKYDKGAFDDPFWSCYFDIFWDPYLYISFFLNSDKFCHLLRIIVYNSMHFWYGFETFKWYYLRSMCCTSFLFHITSHWENVSLILQKDLIFNEWWKSLLAEQLWSCRISFLLRSSRYCTLFKMAIYSYIFYSYILSVPIQFLISYDAFTRLN